MEMGNANMGAMKSTINGIRELMENWEAVGNVLTDAAVGYGIAKVAILAYNAALGKENAAMIATTLTSNKKRAAMLIQAESYRALNVEEQRQIMYANVMRTEDWKSLAVQGN